MGFQKICNISFEPLQECQVEMVKKWFMQDYVAKYWHGAGLQNALAAVERFVVGKEPLFTLWIAYDQETPFAFFMISEVNLSTDLLFSKYCDRNAKAITLDFFIGDPTYLGKKLSYTTLQQLLLQKYSDVTEVFVDPETSNHKAIHVYEKAGFRKCKEFTPEWDPSLRCALLMLKREFHLNDKRKASYL